MFLDVTPAFGISSRRLWKRPIEIGINLVLRYQVGAFCGVHQIASDVLVGRNRFGGGNENARCLLALWPNPTADVPVVDLKEYLPGLGLEITHVPKRAVIIRVPVVVLGKRFGEDSEN